MWTSTGASFGLENMAITMWDHLIPGLHILQSSRYPWMDMTYFTFHRDLESTHEEAMKKQEEEEAEKKRSLTKIGMVLPKPLPFTVNVPVDEA